MPQIVFGCASKLLSSEAGKKCKTFVTAFLPGFSSSHSCCFLGGLNEHRYFQVFGSLHGEELAYGLGMPLTGGSNHLKQNYTFQEQVLSEVMMHYWGNFAKTG